VPSPNLEDLGGIDVIVVGAGNAASSAAVSAHENGARVVMLEVAPEEQRGGNSAFTGGAMRFAFNDLDDVMQVVPDITEEEKKNIEVEPYTENDFFDDLFRMSSYRGDPDLTEILVRNSFETCVWLREQGIKFALSFGRQSYKIDGKFRFWGGMAACLWGGGAQLVQSWHKILAEKGIPVLYEAPALSLLQDGGRVLGVRLDYQGKTRDLMAGAVVLACGGFEANTEMRTRYLGPGWDLARVRGSRFNQGGGIRMALDAGAMPYGNWSGAHACAWDINAPPFGELEVGDLFQKHNYPFGIVVNAKGERFLDEGEDFHSYTYAKYGGEILKQPGNFAWQIFDQRVTHLLRDEYRVPHATKATADTLEELAPKLEGVNAGKFLETVTAYNAATQADIAFDPAIRDAKCTKGLDIEKSNWANPLDTPPFEAFAVTTGITFTFGGIKANADAQVENSAGRPIPGLHVAGEMVGGLYYQNYCSGTGLVSGAVFGRIAGRSAAQYALASK